MGWQITFDGTKRNLPPEDRAAELAENPYASIWEGGKVVDFDDLSPDLFDRIAREENSGDVNWWTIYRSPAGQSARFYKVLSAAADFAGVPVPPKPANMRESLLLLEQVERTEDPTEASETEKDSSTGQSDVSDGSPPPSDENESSIS